MIVHKATGWLPDGRRVTAEDWPSAEIASTALGITKAYAPLMPHCMSFDELADEIGRRLKIDLTRPYGCSIIVED